MKSNQKILTEKQVRNKTVLSFALLSLFFCGCIIGWQWMHRLPKANEALSPLRAGLDANERFFTGIFSDNHLAKTYSKNKAAKQVRVNGGIGMSDGFDPSAWKLQLVKNPGDTLFIGIDEIKSLPKTEIIFNFKCIEGWSQVTYWGGVKFSDFALKYGLQNQVALQYTGLHTPDNGYFVGIDNKSMMHPQTLLCYEMNGAPLPLNQGFPLRLIIPVKYGVKHLKRIGTIFFSNERPPDYWFEKGYDYYSGL
jgi:Oxidoreductase molybdopterin binding domain